MTYPQRKPNRSLQQTVQLVAALGILLGCSGAGTEDLSEIKQTVRQRFPQVRQMQVAELVRLLETGPPARRPLLIDTRAEAEFAVSHLPGAIRAEGSDVETVARTANGRPIVLYCSVGYRSSKAAEALMEEGFEDVANLEGSIFEWANTGHPVVRGDREVREVHPYDQKWGKLLDKKLWAFEPGQGDDTPSGS